MGKRCVRAASQAASGILTSPSAATDGVIVLSTGGGEPAGPDLEPARIFFAAAGSWLRVEVVFHLMPQALHTLRILGE